MSTQSPFYKTGVSRSPFHQESEKEKTESKEFTKKKQEIIRRGKNHPVKAGEEYRTANRKNKQ
tara:strand:+ start:66 stop:254 length:189 start_codon:yes stop_codon:yes gene_type:complete